MNCCLHGRLKTCTDNYVAVIEFQYHKSVKSYV